MALRLLPVLLALLPGQVQSPPNRVTIHLDVGVEDWGGRVRSELRRALVNPLVDAIPNARQHPALPDSKHAVGSEAWLAPLPRAETDLAIVVGYEALEAERAPAPQRSLDLFKARGRVSVHMVDLPALGLVRTLSEVGMATREAPNPDDGIGEAVEQASRALLAKVEGEVARWRAENATGSEQSSQPKPPGPGYERESSAGPDLVASLIGAGMAAVVLAAAVVTLRRRGKGPPQRDKKPSVEPGTQQVMVFLSHCDEDKPFVRQLASELEGHGLRIWIDEENRRGGEPMGSWISRAIDESDCMVVVYSRAARGSRWVEAEMNAALHAEMEGRPIVVVPAILDDCDPPTILAGRMRADFRSGLEDGVHVILRAIGA